MNGRRPAPIETPVSVAQSVMEALAQPTVVLDESLRIVWANDRYLRRFAIEREHAIGSPIALPAASIHALREALGSATDDVAECVVDAEPASVGARRVALRAARMGPATRGIGRILLTLEDVTAPVAAQTGGSRISGSQGGNSGALAAATHDLRQPLQTMTLLGSLLARRVGDPSLLPLIARLEDTVRAMSGMLNTLLDIGRWEAEATRAEPDNFALNELLDRLRTEFAATLRERGVRWRVVGCRRPIHTDQRMLAQMLRNLIHHAAEHARHTRLLLGARPRGQRLRIELWACGFNASDMGSGSTSFLSLVRRLADLLGHRVDFGHRPHGVSVFSIEVPIAQPHQAASRGAANPTTEEARREPRGTVFVIDDDAAVRETMRDLLEATGWSTETFASSEEFLADDRPERSGCVLVDALLPGMSGVELLRALKDRAQRLPAIMLTGAGDVRMAVEAMLAGALNFIEKPVRYEDLLSNIERAFDLLADSGKLASWRESARQRAASLTGRQRQILDMVLAGEPSRNIAAELGVSRRTVENHRAAIMKKMGAGSIPALIRVGIAAG